MGQQRTEALREAAEAEAFLSGAAERSRLAREAADAEGAKLQEARGAADALSGERMTALEEISGLRQRLGAAEAELQHLADSEGEWAGERDARVERLSGQSRLREEALRDLATAESDMKSAAEAATKAQSAAGEAGRALDEARGREQDLRREQAVLESQRALLAGLEASGEGMDAGVKYLLQSSKDRLKSLLIDVLEVPSDNLAIVERALGKSLQVVLVSDKERGMELLSALREGGRGEAMFGLPGFSGFRRGRPDLSRRPGFRGWLADIVKGPADWSGVLEWSLGNHALVESLEAAFVLADEAKHQDVWFWTPEGTGLHSGGALYGGKLSGSDGKEAAGGLLQRKTQFMDTATRLAKLSSGLESVRAGIRDHESRRATALADAEASRILERDAERRADDARGRVR
jgi:chromosome segregation ATPase